MYAMRFAFWIATDLKLVNGSKQEPHHYTDHRTLCIISGSGYADCWQGDRRAKNCSIAVFSIYEMFQEPLDE